jgi:hypothetical protein
MGRNARRLLNEKFSVEKAVDSIFRHLASHDLLTLPSEGQDSDRSQGTRTQHHALAAQA